MFVSVVLIAVSLVLLSTAVWILYRNRKKSVPKGKYDDKNKDRDYYDVAIVGAGPAGSTCAYYLADAGSKVVLLEKAKFPRDKYCGDAVCKIAIEILMDMGIYASLIEENKAHVADSGGLCSPGGYSFIGRSHKVLGEIPAAVAIKRTLLDEAIAMRAKEVGADLRENQFIESALFDPKTGLWSVSAKTGESYKARVLVCADGATSALATKLGIVKTPPDGTCSRAFVKGGTHNFKADGVVFYDKELLPGYAALFRHPNDELNYCCYLIPGNPKVTNDHQAFWHNELLKRDIFLKQALGNNYEIERMKAAALRLGGEAVTTDRHLLIVGDAAGMIDPLTGEGIHHAMDGGKIAAEFLLEALNQGNYTKEAMQIYHDRWMQKFGNDFYWSYKICLLMYRYPILLDAATKAIQRKGNAFLARWADIMTGRSPKFHLLHPQFVTVITFELLRLLLSRKKTPPPKTD